MKRLIYLFIVILFLLCLAAPVFSAETWSYMTDRYTHDAPSDLWLPTFGFLEPNEPMEHFQNLVDIELTDNEHTHHSFKWVAGQDQYDGAEFLLYMNLTYEPSSLKRYDDVFITGTFKVTETSVTETTEINGDVIGQIVLINPYRLGLGGSNSDDVVSVVLRLKSTDTEGFEYNLFLNPSMTGLIPEGPISDYPDYYDYYDHESRPHVPSPSRQADVAAGVGLSTVGIAVANALTKTSTFGSASFNGSFDPASAASGSSAASAATGAAPAASAASSGSSAGGFIGSVKEILKGLWDSLRDMLMDEGRSYAGGKLSESLGEAGFDIDVDDAGDTGD